MLWEIYQNLALLANLDAQSGESTAADATAVNNVISSSALSTISAIPVDSIETSDLNLLRVIVRSLTEISGFPTFIDQTGLDNTISTIETLLSLKDAMTILRDEGLFVDDFLLLLDNMIEISGSRVE